MIFTPQNYNFNITTPVSIQPNITEYLDETNLGIFLQWLFPQAEIIRDRKFPHIKQIVRPDYIIEDYKLIVEFDGPYHYTNSQKYKTDKEQTEIYNEYGYNVIRIPYFVQLTNRVILFLFNNYMNDTTMDIITDFNEYQHGFIDTKILPADFCSNGLKRFNSDLGSLSVHDWGEHVCIGVNNSIIKKVNQLQSMVKVIPDCNTPYITLLLSYIQDDNIKIYNSEIQYFENCVPNKVYAYQLEYKFNYVAHLLFQYKNGSITANLENINESSIENALIDLNIITDSDDIYINNNTILTNKNLILSNKYNVSKYVFDGDDISVEDFRSETFGREDLGNLLDIVLIFE